MRSGAVSTRSYWAKNAFTKSIYVWIWLWSNFMYHLAVDPIRLSWKQWKSNLSFPVCPIIFQQNIVMWTLRQDDPLYLIKSGILNLRGMITSGTNPSSMASIPLIELFPSMAFSLSSIRFTFYWVSSFLGCIMNSTLFFSYSFRSSELWTCRDWVKSIPKFIRLERLVGLV